MESIFNQIKELYAKAEDAGKREIQGYIRELQVGFYSDWDVVMRLTSGPLQLALAKIGIDLNIFTTLTQSDIPAPPSYHGSIWPRERDREVRIHRQRLHQGLFEPQCGGCYLPTVSLPLNDSRTAEANYFCSFDIPGPCTQAMPDFLAETKYQNITSNKQTVFQKAFDTDLTLFEWMPQHPKHMKSLGHLMALERPVHWVDKYPVEERLGSLATKPDEAVLVDVGGGFGQQAIAFKAKFPNLPGRVIVQDIPQTLAGARPVPGIEFVEHDFFGPQTVKGAKLYYLRHVLHDWPDKESLQILKNIIPAMGPDSCLIIDDVVLPEMGVPWQSAYMDLIMMNSLGGVERTKPEWEALLSEAGLKIVEIHQYDSKMQSIIVTVPK
ncbi:uncharacterized protein PODANS_2_7430 [Podospora anserina S mat+]|uniref:Podospora anserina S mat+ genomic DNA chromosome 2, supercontig 2 n=1 Tax=Podospora anserina (strain S / ATCC MYA-4624 / DSM 980 / FGSC 10383) TaxID=515849 RepID=B2B6D0_PODAN|nr:uncharacterized protein PODANS_2_7430 [Podospora anserina S mat+]CAP73355.1 unnamed protein product [Podospora anserina S mat+]